MVEFVVHISAELCRELEESFAYGPINEAGERDHLMEFLVFADKSVKVEIFSNEHPPPHFRGKYRNRTGSYRIDDCVRLNASRVV